MTRIAVSLCTFSLLTGAIALFAACSGTSSPSSTSTPPNVAPGDAGPTDGRAAVVPSEPPDGSTPEGLGYRVAGAKGYYLVGNKLVRGDEFVALDVTTPASTTSVDLFIDGAFAVREQTGASSVTVRAPLGKLEPGTHEVLLAATGETTAFARVSFIYSHPFYVFVSNDWDMSDNDPTNKVWGMEQELHDRHPALKLTHFVGPYTFTDPAVTEARRKEIVTWLKGMQAKHDDEVGLHIHPYCNFVTAAGVKCRTVPNFGAKTASADTTEDATGYRIVLAAYSSDELSAMLKKADALFVQYGLAKPTSFRAGGWTSETNVLQALSDDGFVTDASGCNWARLQSSWGGYLLADWNKTHWASINDTSQPYFPSQASLLSDAAPRFRTLEVPDNGILVDYITGTEMVRVFDENWAPGTALASPKVLSIGYHPVSLVRAGDEAWLGYLHTAMDHADKYLASGGQGPVVYVRGSDIPQGWPSAP